MRLKVPLKEGTVQSSARLGRECTKEKGGDEGGCGEETSALVTRMTHQRDQFNETGATGCRDATEIGCFWGPYKQLAFCCGPSISRA